MKDSQTLRFLTGERIYLRALLEEDLQGPYVEWFNDETVCQGNSHFVYPYTKNKASEYIQYANRTDKDLIFAMILKENSLHIGNIALSNINWLYRNAELSIILGDKNAWGKGYGLEAGNLVLKHGFSALNLKRIACATFEHNIGMKKLAQALGMKEEGVRRQAAYKNGSYVDVIEYGILKEEFKQPQETISSL